MLTADGKRLEVFDNFQFDFDLPKFKRPPASVAPGDIGNLGLDSMTAQNFHVMNVHPRIIMAPPMGVVSTNVESAAPVAGTRWGAWVYSPKPERKYFWPAWLRKLFARKQEADPRNDAVSVEEFFTSVKNSAEELAVVKERARGYEEALSNAKRTGQVALYEKLEEGLTATRAEAQLIALGLKKTVSEESVVTFYKKCKKGLRLDYVRHFTRTVPAAVVSDKERADAVGAFDNYVVLHYDPQEKAFAEPEADKRARRDPILFGLIKGKRTLYFVGDWVDVVCDLTLDQLADVLGKDSDPPVVQELS